MMRIRLATLSNLAAMAALDSEFTIPEFARHVGWNTNSARNIINRYTEANLLDSKWGTITENTGRTIKARYYTLTPQAVELLIQRKPEPTRPKVRGKRVNSVFALGGL